jgi:hypothetical protein
MSERRHLGPATCLLGAALLVAPAVTSAHSPGHDGFYLGGGVGSEWFSLPSVEAIIDGSRNEIGGTDGSFWAESAHLVVGYGDSDGLSLPDPIGQNARVEAHLRYTRGDSDASADSTDDLGFVPINNPTFGANGTTFPTQNTAYSQTDLTQWDVDLLYRTDVRFDDVLVFTPFVGLTYSRTELENAFTIFGDGVDVSDYFDLDDQIETHYGGLVLGSDATFRPLDFLSLRLGVRADLMGATAKLAADQTLFDGLHPFPGTGTFRENRESDRAADFAARATATAGIGVDMGALRLGVDGFVRYHSWVPMAAHPTQDGFLGAAPHRTSHIDGRAAWSAGWMARLTILLP